MFGKAFKATLGVGCAIIVGLVALAVISGVLASGARTGGTGGPILGSGAKITIVSDSGQPSGTGTFMEVVGEVRNDGTATARFVKVTVTFYDDAGKVMDTTFTFTNPSDVSPGATAPFKTSVLRREGMTQYKTQVSWQ